MCECDGASPFLLAMSCDLTAAHAHHAELVELAQLDGMRLSPRLMLLIQFLFR